MLAIPARIYDIGVIRSPGIAKPKLKAPVANDAQVDGSLKRSNNIRPPIGSRFR